jgi:superfamily II DNA or RNA helicase
MLKSEIGIRRSGISFKMSADEQTEYVSVRSIYITLLKNIVILREDGTVGKIKLRPYQRDILDNFMGHRFNILMSSRQSGKTISASIFILHFILFNNDKNVIVAK